MADLDPTLVASIRAMRDEGKTIREISNITGLSDTAISRGAPARSEEERTRWRQNHHSRASQRERRRVSRADSPVHIATGTHMAADRRCVIRVLADTKEEAERFLLSLGGELDG